MTKREAGRARASITTAEISPAKVIRSVADPGAGATVLFIGTVRDLGDSGRVREMTYEAYTPLARRRLAEIAQETLRRWRVSRVTIVHRIGTLRLKEVSVVVGVSSPHRQEAFEASRFAIDEVKKAVPIWKREGLSTGVEVWTKGERMADATPAEAR